MVRTRIVDLKQAVEGHITRLEFLSNEFRSLVAAHKIQVSENELNQITDIGNDLYKKLAQVLNVTQVSLELKNRLKGDTVYTPEVEPIASSKL